MNMNTLYHDLILVILSYINERQDMLSIISICKQMRECEYIFYNKYDINMSILINKSDTYENNLFNNFLSKLVKIKCVVNDIYIHTSKVKHITFDHSFNQPVDNLP